MFLSIQYSYTHGYFYFPFLLNEHELYCIYYFLIDSEPNGRSFGSKSIGKWLTQSDLGWFNTTRKGFPYMCISACRWKCLSALFKFYPEQFQFAKPPTRSNMCIYIYDVIFIDMIEFIYIYIFSNIPTFHIIFWHDIYTCMWFEILKQNVGHLDILY